MSGKPNSLSPGMVEVCQPELQSRGQAAEDPAGDWLCAWCMNRVANERDRFNVGGKNEFTFANPEGIAFDIITFSQTVGCRETGVPTRDYTWFEDHAWSYCECAECRQHLGWYYSGPHRFVGLIKSRLVRALHMRN